MSQGQQINAALAVARAVGVPENVIKLWKPDIEYLPDNCTKYSCGAGKHDQRCHKKASRDRAAQWLRNINEGTMQWAQRERSAALPSALEEAISAVEASQLEIQQFDNQLGEAMQDHGAVEELSPVRRPCLSRLVFLQPSAHVVSLVLRRLSIRSCREGPRQRRAPAATPRACPK